MAQEFHLVPVDSGWGQFLRPKNSISQAEMAEVMWFLRCGDEHLAMAEQRILSIIERMEQGQAIEQGSIVAELKTTETRDFNCDSVSELVGERVVQKLHRQLTPRTTKTLLLHSDNEPRQSLH